MSDDSEPTDTKLTRGLMLMTAYLLVGWIVVTFAHGSSGSWWPAVAFLASFVVVLPAFAFYVARLRDQPFWETLFHPGRFEGD